MSKVRFVISWQSSLVGITSLSKREEGGAVVVLDVAKAAGEQKVQFDQGGKSTTNVQAARSHKRSRWSVPPQTLRSRKDQDREVK
jgi:hypothetical protein